MDKIIFFYLASALCLLAQVPKTVQVHQDNTLLQPTSSEFYSANPPPIVSGTITLTGSVTGSGTSSIATTIINVPWSTLSGSLTAGGDLQGSYPNPSVNKVQGVLPAAGVANALGNLPNASGGFLTFSGGAYQIPLTFGPNLLLTGTNVDLAGTTGTGSIVRSGSPTFTGTPVSSNMQFTAGGTTFFVGAGGSNFQISQIGSPFTVPFSIASGAPANSFVLGSTGTLTLGGTVTAPAFVGNLTGTGSIASTVEQDAYAQNLNNQTFIFEGDSITFGLGISSPTTNCYGALFSQSPWALNHGAYLNVAVSGSACGAGTNGGQTVTTTGTFSSGATAINLTTSPTPPAGIMSVTGSFVPLGTLGTLSGTTVTLSQAITGTIPGGSILTFGGNNITDRYYNQVYPNRPTANGGTGGARVYLFVMIGTNPDVSPPTITGKTTEITAITTYNTRALADGFTLVQATILPRWAGNAGALAFSPYQNGVNQAIRSQTIPMSFFWDAALALRDNTNQTYFQSDNLHPNAAGHVVLSNALLRAVYDRGSPPNTEASKFTNAIIGQDGGFSGGIAAGTGLTTASGIGFNIITPDGGSTYTPITASNGATLIEPANGGLTISGSNSSSIALTSTYGTFKNMLQITPDGNFAIASGGNSLSGFGGSSPGNFSFLSNTSGRIVLNAGTDYGAMLNVNGDVTTKVAGFAVNNVGTDNTNLLFNAYGSGGPNHYGVTSAAYGILVNGGKYSFRYFASGTAGTSLPAPTTLFTIDGPSGGNVTVGGTLAVTGSITQGGNAVTTATVHTLTGTLSSGTATVTVPSGVNPWVQDNASSLTNVGALQVTVSGTVATVTSNQPLDASPFHLFYWQ